MTYFGDPWDAPAFEDAEQVPAPTGAPCDYCEEPIAEDDRGVITTGAARGEDGRPVPKNFFSHLECFLLAVTGPLAHLEGRCGCPSPTATGAVADPDGEKPWREQGREVMAWLENGQRKDSEPDRSGLPGA